MQVANESTLTIQSVASDWTVVRGLRDSTGGGPTGLLGCVLPRSLQYKMTSSVIANKDMTNGIVSIGR